MSSVQRGECKANSPIEVEQNLDEAHLLGPQISHLFIEQNDCIVAQNREGNGIEQPSDIEIFGNLLDRQPFVPYSLEFEHEPGGERSHLEGGEGLRSPSIRLVSSTMPLRGQNAQAPDIELCRTRRGDRQRSDGSAECPICSYIMFEDSRCRFT